jgi:transcriptional regulator with XRE-family HTH domain
MDIRTKVSILAEFFVDGYSNNHQGISTKEENMQTLGERIRQVRKAAGLTQKQLEEASGVPQNTISRVEIGSVQEISTKTLVGLAKALNVSADYLLGLKEEPEPLVKVEQEA